MYAGQSVGAIAEVEPAAAIVERFDLIWREALRHIERRGVALSPRIASAGCKAEWGRRAEVSSSKKLSCRSSRVDVKAWATGCLRSPTAHRRSGRSARAGAHRVECKRSAGGVIGTSSPSERRLTNE